METDFKISLEGFASQEDAKTIGNFVLEATRQISEGSALLISKLKVILITFDFDDALRRVTSSYNHKSPSEFTNSKQATAVGKLVSKTNSSGSFDEHTLVLSVAFFGELFDEEGNIKANEESVKSVMHRLHHELVHVHEKNTLTCLDPAFSVNAYGDALLIPASRVWSEYLANVVSARTVTPQILEDFINNMVRVVSEVPNEIEEEVNKFKLGLISLDTMYVSVKKRVELIINSYGYAMGYIHGLGLDVAESYPYLFKVLSESKLNKSLTFIGEELKTFLIKYNNNEITNYDDYLKITRAIDSVYKALGIDLVCDGWTGEKDFCVYVD